MNERSTPTGVPIIECSECGHSHPVTRSHCASCGRAHLFPGACPRGGMNTFTNVIDLNARRGDRSSAAPVGPFIIECSQCPELEPAEITSLDAAVETQRAHISRVHPPQGEIVLLAEAGQYKTMTKRPSYLTGWWASRALGDATLGDEDREMALAAYSRSFDVQMGTTRGPKGGIRPGFPNEDGGDFIRKAEARRLARDAEIMATADDGALFRMEEFA